MIIELPQKAFYREKPRSQEGPQTPTFKAKGYSIRLWGDIATCRCQISNNNVYDDVDDDEDDNGNFICVFECTIVNLATYRQFTNAA